jgi:hypothetical protein
MLYEKYMKETESSLTITTTYNIQHTTHRLVVKRGLFLEPLSNVIYIFHLETERAFILTLFESIDVEEENSN